MTTADDETTKAVLDERGYTYIEGESILAEVDDRPGGMARLARALADADVNIYGHLFLGRWGDTRDVRVRGRRPGEGAPDPRTEGLRAAHPTRRRPFRPTSGMLGTFVLEGRSGQRPGLPPFRPRSTPTP